MPECNHCQSTVLSNWAHCVSCGNMLKHPQCLACTAPISPDWAFCAHCGVHLNQFGEPVYNWSGPEPRCRVLHLTDLHITEDPEKGLVETHGLGTFPTRTRLKGILETAGHEVDQIVITGDFTDCGADAEYEAVLNILMESGLQDRITMIPGNHELVQGSTFTSADKDANLRRFYDWCGPFLPKEVSLPHLFPYTRWLHDRILFVGLDTTGEGRSLYNSSRGSVDQEQLRKLKKLLDSIPDGVFKLIGIHHSLQPPKARKSFINGLVDRFFMYLDNADSLKQLLLQYQNLIVIHGHHHTEYIHEEGRDSAAGRIVSLGAASSVLIDEELETLQYVVLEFYDDAVLSVARTYEDTPTGIRVVGEPTRRRFSLQKSPIPRKIRRILETPRFRQTFKDRLELYRWRTHGQIDHDTRDSLSRPGFLRSAKDMIKLRKQGLAATQREP